jgi:hypothetical protein
MIFRIRHISEPVVTSFDSMYRFFQESRLDGSTKLNDSGSYD